MPVRKVTPSHVRAVNEAWQSTLNLTEALGSLLALRTDSRTFRTSIHDAGLALEATRQVALDYLSTHKSSMPWEPAVLLVRALDRVLSLASLINTELREEAGCQPFTALLIDGTRTMCDLIESLDNWYKNMGRRHGGHSLRSSGPIVEAASMRQADFSRVYWFGDVVPELRLKLRLGVAGDCLDLAEDMSRFLAANSGVPALSSMAPVVKVWNDVAAANKEVMPRRASWRCGALLDLDEVAINLGLTPAEVSAMRANREILSLRSWDGSLLFPSIQLLEVPGSLTKRRLPSQLATLLKEDVDLSVCSPWALAIWMGGRTARGDRNVDMLDSPQGLSRACSNLAKSGTLRRDSPRRPDPGDADILRQDQLALEIASGHWASIEGQGAKYADWWANASLHAKAAPTKLQPKLYRLTQRGYGAFRFTSAFGQDPEDCSRFDLNIEGKGACYFSGDPQGAYFEVFSRLLAFDVQELAMYTMWELATFERVERLLDLRNLSKTSKRFDVTSDVAYSRARADTQRMASEAHAASFMGIVHPIRSRPSSTGYAIFGDAGWSAPEKSGLGSWDVFRANTTELAHFSTFLLQKAPARGWDAVFNQLPIRKVLPAERP